jgi:hypothetical protein
MHFRTKKKIARRSCTYDESLLREVLHLNDCCDVFSAPVEHFINKIFP